MRLKNSGYTLIEAVFAAALVAVVAAGIASIMTMVSGTMQNSGTIQDEYNVMNQIRTWFENEESCRLALGGPMRFDDTNTSASPYAQQVNPVNPTNIKIYQPVRSNTARPVFLDPANAATSTIGHWVATAITIRPLPGTTFVGGLWRGAIVTVTLARTNDSTNRGYISTPNYVTVRLDATRNILSCSSNNFRSDGQASPVCQAPYWAPSTVTSDGSSPISAGPYLNCRRIACPPGSTPTGGWDNYGNLNCFP